MRENKLQIGKRSEYEVWALLLKGGLDVFPAIVDDKGIDGIVGYNGKYCEIQIKSGANWKNQRGLKYEIIKKHKDRIFIIFNYEEEQLLFFTGEQILNEPEFKKTIRWDISQLKLNNKMREKYKNQRKEDLIKFIKDKARN